MPKSKKKGKAKTYRKFGGKTFSKAVPSFDTKKEAKEYKKKVKQSSKKYQWNYRIVKSYGKYEVYTRRKEK